MCGAFAISAEWSYEGSTITLARLNISYTDPTTGTYRTDVSEVGKYGGGYVGVAAGILVMGYDKSGGEPNGCTRTWAASASEPWVALVSRGVCADQKKVENALAQNASGVLIYSKEGDAHLQKIALSSFSQKKGVVVFLGHAQGEELARMVDNGTKVHVSITRGQDVKYRITNINRTSVLFVSVSFIILMVISLAWLIFYYIQRFRYHHAKDRLARHLCNAAKKALSKIPLKNLKSGDNEVTADSECCAICIEPYQISETVRTLPCKHQFHKCCVDPWLLEHRTCPMCKMDILKFYGYVLSDSEESVLQLDMIEEPSGGDVEAQAPTPPTPPANPRSSSISQVMVVPRAEAAGTDISCEGWSESPVPDTPISPVHQPQSAMLPGSAACSVLRSVIDSAKTRVNQSAKVSSSSQTPPCSAVSRESQPPSPLPETDTATCLEASGNNQEDTFTQSQNKNDLELSSISSEDFVDARVVEDEMDQNALSFATAVNPNIVIVSGADSRLDLVSSEDSTPNHQCEATPSCSPSVPSSADTRVSSKVGSPSRKGSTLLPRSTSRSRSLSKKRSSGSRTRSTSKRRSASHARSTSRGRSSGRPDSSSHSGSSSSAARSARTQSRPSSYVVNVSHV